MSKQPPPAPTTSAVGPCPTVIQIVGRPSAGSLPSTIAPPDHPPSKWNTVDTYTQMIWLSFVYLTAFFYNNFVYICIQENLSNRKKVKVDERKISKLPASPERTVGLCPTINVPALKATQNHRVSRPSSYQIGFNLLIREKASILFWEYAVCHNAQEHFATYFKKN